MLAVRGVAKEKRREERRGGRRRRQGRKSQDHASSSSLAMASPDAGCTADENVQQDHPMGLADPVLRQTEPGQLGDAHPSGVENSAVTQTLQRGDGCDTVAEQVMSRLHGDVETQTLCANSTHGPPAGAADLLSVRAPGDAAGGSRQPLSPLSIAQAAATAAAARFAARQDALVFGDGGDESGEDTALLEDSTEGQEPVALRSQPSTKTGCCHSEADVPS